MIIKAWFSVTVASYPCYILGCLADWGSGIRANGVNTYLISYWEGVARD